MLKTLIAGAMLASTSFSWGAVCFSSPTNLGTLSASSFSQGVRFSAGCTAPGRPDPADTAAWSFTNYHRFRLAEDASSVWGGLNLNFTRTGQVIPNSPNPGDPFYMIGINSISFIHNGVTTFVGTEGAGHHEHASILGFDLEAGDYLMEVRGRVFNTATRSGWYDGTLNMTPANAVSAMSLVAAPVPEPATSALLLLGIPVVGWAAGRKSRRGGAGEARAAH